MKELLQRIKNNLASSKLDLSIFISCILVAGLCITLLVIIISRDAAINNQVVIHETASPTDAVQLETTTAEEITTVQEETTIVYDVFEDGTPVSIPTRIRADITAANDWESEGDTYIQYNIEVTNVTSRTIPSWELVVVFTEAVSVSDSWGGTFTSYGERLDIKPVAYTEELQPGETKTLGVILSAENYAGASLYSIKAEGVSEAVSLSEGENVTVAEEYEETAGESTVTGQQQTVFQEPEAASSKQTYASSGTGFYSQHGALHVSGANLYDSNGNLFQIKGVSTHGLSWFPEYVNQSAFSSLKSFGVNAIRLAMYTGDYNGYCTGGDQASLKNLVKNGINYATEEDLYVIVDWHILNDSNPNTYIEQAVSFFNEISRSFGDQSNILYEICNEPNGGTPWYDGSGNDIKTYAERVINTIRSNDSDAVIIVGTPTWSQDVDVVAANPLDTSKYSNIMYALHFYAATHTDFLRDKFLSAYQQGLPVFVSEFSICESSGNGRNDTVSAGAWMDLLNSHGISYVAWNLSNKAESSSLLNSSCSKTGAFTYDDFSESGKWYLNQLQN